MKIAVIGATGLVGKKVIEQLKEKNFEIIAYATKKSKGKKVCGISVNTLTRLSIKKVDFAIFSAGSETSKKFAPLFAKKGAIVIDNSSAFRKNKDIPLVVPEINASSISESSKIIANPNCSTIQLVLVLFYLSKTSKIKRVIVSTFQSASGGGEKGIFDLENKTTLKFPHILSDDLLPQIGKFQDNLYSEEENKIMFETQKILDTNIDICSTCVRVPIHFCHGESVNVEFENEVDIELVKEKLETSNGIVLNDNPKENIYPLCKNAHGSTKIHVGRIRKDPSNKNAINLWIVSDNVLKGASTNAIQILEYLLKKRGDKK